MIFVSIRPTISGAVFRIVVITLPVPAHGTIILIPVHAPLTVHVSAVVISLWDSPVGIEPRAFGFALLAGLIGLLRCAFRLDRSLGLSLTFGLLRIRLLCGDRNRENGTTEQEQQCDRISVAHGQTP
jgi:hypothetical protein